MPLKIAFPDRPISFECVENGHILVADYGTDTWIVLAVSEPDKPPSFVILRAFGRGVLGATQHALVSRGVLQQSELHVLGGLTVEPLGSTATHPPLPSGSVSVGDMVIDSHGRTMIAVDLPQGYNRGAMFGLGLTYFDVETGKSAKPIKPLTAYSGWRIVRRGDARDDVTVFVEHQPAA